MGNEWVDREQVDGKVGERMREWMDGQMGKGDE